MSIILYAQIYANNCGKITINNKKTPFSSTTDSHFIYIHMYVYIYHIVIMNKPQLNVDVGKNAYLTIFTFSAVYVSCHKSKRSHGTVDMQLRFSHAL